MKFLAHLPRMLNSSTTSAPWQRVPLRRLAAILLTGLATAIAASTPAQSPAPQPAQQAPAAPASSQPEQPTAAPAPGSSKSSNEVTEDGLKSLLVGKPLFLRGGYLGDSISFNEHGAPTGHPAVGSYTLSGVQIDRVRLSKHKVELVGSRYALHFLGALPYEDPDKAVDRVKITPKKKVLRITIDREQVIKEKKAKAVKESAKDKGKKPASAKNSPATGPATGTVASSETDVAAPASAAAAPQTQAAPATTAQAEPAADEKEEKEDPADQAADKASVTTTISPAHAAQMLHEALDKIFSPGLDDKVRAQMPQFWQLYYQAQAAGIDYRPADHSILRSNAVDSQAKVLSSIAPDSNEFAQSNGIAGRALYRVVIGADGKPGEIAVIRPIGFGLDENAVASIRKATFQPALKGGQPVAETLDLAVLFRIYSKRTSGTATEDKAADAAKPGPYTARAAQEKQPEAPPEKTPEAQPETKPETQPEPQK